MHTPREFCVGKVKRRCVPTKTMANILINFNYGVEISSPYDLIFYG